MTQMRVVVATVCALTSCATTCAPVRLGKSVTKGIGKMTIICDNAGAETMAHQQAVSEKDGLVQLSASTDIQDFTSVTLGAVEEFMLEQEQVDCPVEHHFGPGIYIREVFFPAGIYVMGHAHKKPTMNILLKGKMAVMVNGAAKVIEGPYIFNSEPGRKFAYVIEDCVFQNILATEETDLKKIEEIFIDTSDAWKNKQVEVQNLKAIDQAVSQHLEGIKS